jgi:hypothetical protein
MADVLGHPFFALKELELPVVPYHGQGLDVIISYQSTQAHIRRFTEAVMPLVPDSSCGRFLTCGAYETV